LRKPSLPQNKLHFHSFIAEDAISLPLILTGKFFLGKKFNLLERERNQAFTSEIQVPAKSLQKKKKKTHTNQILPNTN
jgi:hypothetical protein